MQTRAALLTLIEELEGDMRELDPAKSTDIQRSFDEALPELKSAHRSFVDKLRAIGEAL